jgi:hypothetical protein
MVMQWGVVTGTFCGPNSTTTVAYNAPFGTSVYNIQVTPRGSSSSQKAWTQVQSANNSSFVVRFQSINSDCIDGFYWTAIGQ